MTTRYLPGVTLRDLLKFWDAHPEIKRWFLNRQMSMNYQETAREILGMAYNYANAGGTVTEDYLIKAAVAIYRNHDFFKIQGNEDVNEWLRQVMNINGVTCENCDATWVAGLGKEKADSQDEARVSAHAHDWSVDTGKVLCPDCKEKEG